MSLSSPESQLEQARSLYGCGNLLESKKLCLQVLATNPGDAEALKLLGIIAGDRGDLRKAVAFAFESLRCSPSNPSAPLRRLAVDCEKIERKDDLPDIYRALLLLDSGDELARLALADLLADRQRFDEALEHYRSALKHNPRIDAAYWKTAAVLQRLGRHQEAIQHCWQALNINPNANNAAYTLGKIFRDLRMIPEAVTCFRKTIALDPKHASALNSLGAALFELQEIEEAILCLERALALDPDYPAAHYNHSVILLLRGDYTQGWQEFEWRWKTDVVKASRRNFPQPQWRGDALDNRTILVHVEGGLGDTIQFVRYVPELQARGGNVVLECQPELKTLLTLALPGCRVVGSGEPLPPFDLHCPYFSLPLAFQTTLDTIPARTPYLWPESGKVEKWRTRVANDRGHLKVGLVWAGGSQATLDSKRSISLEALLPLASIDGLTFYSLQKQKPEANAASPGLDLVDFSADFTDFAETAALVANLDLIIAVDTSTAHLAGAMGKPVWVLLPGYAEWRWQTDREDTPWYPTMRLFRHPKNVGWEVVIGRVKEALSSFSPSVRASDKNNFQISCERHGT